uniref:Uncharacterized protein n=1 Tax=Gasterosteus aculeatus aculeatus TaxID=481459 RepID=A0AAQ4REG2_GASAC
MSNDHQQGEPAPRRRLVPCIIIFVLGVGSLLPWNFFIIASQYFQRRLAAEPSTTSGGGGYSYELWMTLAANLPLVVSSLLNCLCTSGCGRGLPAALRRCCGRGLPAAPCGSCDLKHCPLVVFTMVLIIGLFAATAVLVDVDMEPRIFFYVTMATIVVINSGVPEQAYFIIPCVVAAVTLACYLCLGMSPRTHTHGDGVDSPQQDSQEPPGSTGRLLSPCSHSCYFKSFIVAFQLIRAQKRLVINRRSASKATRP